MKNIIVFFGLTALAANIASANMAPANGASDPRAYCRSDDGKKVVRVHPAAFGDKMQAEVSHKGALQYILKCEYNEDYLYYCTDGDNDTPRVFTLELDGRTGIYEGNRQTTHLNCRLY